MTTDAAITLYYLIGSLLSVIMLIAIIRARRDTKGPRTILAGSLLLTFAIYGFFTPVDADTAFFRGVIILLAMLGVVVGPILIRVGLSVRRKALAEAANAADAAPTTTPAETPPR